MTTHTYASDLLVPGIAPCSRGLRGIRWWVSLALLFAVQVASSAVIKVPGDHATIQAAISASAAGDVIWVAQGTYKENLTLKAGVRLEGGWKTGFSARNWLTWPSVVDGDGKYSVVVGAAGAVLDGFTLRNGKASSGAGMRVVNAAMTIKNNTIEDNTASSVGGGIYISGHPQQPPFTDITNNVIRRNQVTSDQGGTGGGIHVTKSASGIRITNNTIGGALGDGNQARWGGGGIYVEQTPVIQIERNKITQNSVSKGHGGGVMIVDGSPNATLGENLIEYNSANGNYGGGVYSIGGTFVFRNRIGKNSLFNQPSWGGGIVIDSHSGTSPRIENNFFYANLADKAGGIYLLRGQNVIFMNNSVSANKPDQPNAGGGMYVAAGATCILQNTILWGNGDDLYEETADACTLSHNDIEDGDDNGVDGNISANPQFAAYDDLHISSGSPVINAGRSDAAPSIDIDGDPRGGKIDIGADELPAEDGTPCPLVKSASASYLEPHLGAVRDFRDHQLMRSATGRALIRWYYDRSPAVSGMLDSYPALKPVLRIIVTPVVYLIAYPVQGVLFMLGGTVLLILARRRRV